MSKDPNNLRWTKDPNNFGHRMLRSQGWTPGSFLGPQDAPHAELHSAASASYIRVAMKDDAGGLGYRAGGGGDDDIAGMDEVKSIFDRLNGVVESEEAKKERERRKALVYLGQRVGGITFVRGGLLVQEGLDMVEMREKERVEALKSKGKRKADEIEEEAPRKKRKGDDEKEEKRRRKEEKRKRKAKNADSETSPVESSTPTEDDEAKPKSKKSKPDKSASEPPADPKEERRKDKKKKRPKSKSTDPATDPSSEAPPKKSKKSKSETPSSESTSGASRKEKKSKEEKNREKKERREKKRLKKASKSSEEDEVSDTSPADSDAPMGTSTPTSGPGVRHIHHARKVAAKRAAMTDAAALKQVGVVLLLSGWPGANSRRSWRFRLRSILNIPYPSLAACSHGTWTAITCNPKSAITWRNIAAGFHRIIYHSRNLHTGTAK